jgi:hypothetical protein
MPAVAELELEAERTANATPRPPVSSSARFSSTLRNWSSLSTPRPARGLIWNSARSGATDGIVVSAHRVASATHSLCMINLPWASFDADRRTAPRTVAIARRGGSHPDTARLAIRDRALNRR